MPKQKQLRDRARKFVTEYLKCRNVGEAAIRAGYSKKWAASIGSRLLHKDPRIQKIVNDQIAAVEERAQISVAEVIQELKTIAMVDLRRAYNKEGGLLPVSEMPDDIAHALAGVDTEELFAGVGQDREQVGNLVKARFHSKVQALELLGKHLKMFTDKIEHTMSEDMFERLERARKNVAV